LVSVDARAAQAPADDPLPPGAIQRLGTSRWRCVTGVQCAAFAPDGKLFAIICDDGVARLWDAATGRELHTFDQAGGPCLAFAPDGKYLAVPGRAEQRALLIDVATRQVVRAMAEKPLPENPGFRPPVSGLAFSPDGKTLATAVSGRQSLPGPRGRGQTPAVSGLLQIWEVATGKELGSLSLPPVQVFHLAFAHGGKYIAVGTQTHLLVFDAATRKELHRREWVYGAFNFDIEGANLWYRADGLKRDSYYDQIDLRTGKTLNRHTLERGEAVAAPGGRLLLVPRMGAARTVWDVATGKKLCALAGVRGHTEVNDGAPDVLPLAVTHDGKTLAAAVGRSGHREQTVRLFDLATGQERQQPPGHREGVRQLAISKDGRRIVSSGSDETVCLWDRATGKLRRRWEHPERMVGVAISADGNWVAGVADDRVVLWDATTGAEQTRWVAPNARVAPASLSHARFTPDARSLVTGEGYAHAEVWDVATGQRRTLFKHVHGGRLADMALSPDGRHAAQAGGSGVVLWDVTTGKVVRQMNPHNGGIQAVAFSADGKALATVYYGLVDVFDVATGGHLRALDVGNAVNAVAFSPDGKMLATGRGWPHVRGTGLPENIVQLWDVATGKELRRFAGHRDGVTAVAFTPDGRAVVSASADNTLLIWATEAR
jgi:WD40 repeat protein